MVLGEGFMIYWGRGVILMVSQEWGNEKVKADER